MVRSIITLGLVSFSMLAYAGAKDFIVKGKIGTLNAPAKAYLMYSINDQQFTDSAILVKGAFVFKGKLEDPARATLIISHDGKSPDRYSRKQDKKELYLENTTITISATDSISKATISGSPVNKDADALQTAMKPVDEKMSALYKEYSAATEDIQKSAAFQERMTAREKQIETAKKEVAATFIKSHPNSIVSLYALRESTDAIPESVEQPMALFNSLSPVVRNTAAAKKYEAFLTKQSNLSIGKMAPAFELPDTSGTTIALSSFKGKYVLIDFWASWCHPCRGENPVLVKAYAAYHPKGLEILGVSLDMATKKSAWTKAIQDDHLTWPQVSDLKYWKSDVAALYAIQAIPQNFLLDPSGKIIAKNLRGEALEKKLAELFE